MLSCWLRHMAGVDRLERRFEELLRITERKLEEMQEQIDALNAKVDAATATMADAGQKLVQVIADVKSLQDIIAAGADDKEELAAITQKLDAGTQALRATLSPPETGGGEAPSE